MKGGGSCPGCHLWHWPNFHGDLQAARVAASSSWISSSGPTSSRRFLLADEKCQGSPLLPLSFVCFFIVSSAAVFLTSPIPVRCLLVGGGSKNPLQRKTSLQEWRTKMRGNISFHQMALSTFMVMGLFPLFFSLASLFPPRFSRSVFPLSLLG